jgi:hypothetical protein
MVFIIWGADNAYPQLTIIIVVLQLNNYVDLNNKYMVKNLGFATNMVDKNILL